MITTYCPIEDNSSQKQHLDNIPMQYTLHSLLLDQKNTTVNITTACDGIRCNWENIIQFYEQTKNSLIEYQIIYYVF